MLFLDTACNMIDKCCRFRYTKKLYSHEHVRRVCILLFNLIKLKNSRYFYIIKSQFFYLKMRYSPYVNKGFVYISVSKILNFIRQLFIFS